jgi:hypothetical protein
MRRAEMLRSGPVTAAERIMAFVRAGKPSGPTTFLLWKPTKAPADRGGLRPAPRL